MNVPLSLMRILFLLVVFSCFLQSRAQSTFLVINTADSGAGSLRQAIFDANSTPGVDNIYFNIPGMAPHKLNLTYDLPTISEGVLIHGGSQPNNGYTGSDPKIEIDCSGFPSNAGLFANCSDVSIFGLYIHGSLYGILLQSGGNYMVGGIMNGNVVSDNVYGISIIGTNAIVQYNYIGTKPNGNDTLGTQQIGVTVGLNQYMLTRNVQVKNNLISSIGIAGIGVGYARNVTIHGNKIGTNAAGTAKLSKLTGAGIQVDGLTSDSVFIGGSVSGQGNLISGNAYNPTNGNGITVSNMVNKTLVIKGNLIGTDITGTVAIPNATGISCTDVSTAIIGGSGPGERNIVSGNYEYGISVGGRSIIKGNYVGVTANGTAPLGNGSNYTAFMSTISGIHCTGKGHMIGGPGINEGNTVSNNPAGITISSCDSTTIQGNRIGTDANGNGVMGNLYFGMVINFSDSCVIGGPTSAHGNVIAHHPTNGITMHTSASSPCSSNRISHNVFYNNGIKGINHAYFNSTPANNGFPKPVITFSSTDSVKGTAAPLASVELYYHQSNNSVPQGKVFIASVTTNSTGNWIYVGTISQPCNVVALAIDNNSNTSEFSDFPLPGWSPNLGPDMSYNCVSSVTLDPGVSNLSYQWSTGATTQGITINASGTYWVAVTDACGNSQSDTVSVTITVPTSVAFASLPPSCEDAPAFALTAASPAGGTYSGAGVSGNMFDPAVAGAGFHTITYNYTDANGCSSSASQNITVNALPAVTFASLAAVCHNALPVQLSGGAPAGGAYTGTSVSNNTFDPSIGLGSYAIIYTFTDGNGCSSSAVENITVHALPAVTLSSFNGTCENSLPMQLSGGLPAGGSYLGTAITSGIFDPSLAGAGQHLVTYTYIDANGCTNSDTASLVVYSAPAVTLSSFADVCADTVQVALNGGSPSGGTYSGTAVTGSAFDPSVAGAGTHAITYNVTDTNGCTSQASENIIVHALPQAPSITQNLSDLISSQGTSYQWYLNDSIIAGATQQVLTPAVNGNYSVMVNDSNGCSAVSSAFPFYSVGIAPNTGDASFSLFPNPASGTLYWTANEQGGWLLIHDVTGRLVKTAALAAGTGAVDIAALAAGPYMCTMMKTDGTFANRMRIIVK
jgi:parallel beta-helix repeat protein